MPNGEARTTALFGFRSLRAKTSPGPYFRPRALQCAYCCHRCRRIAWCIRCMQAERRVTDGLPSSRVPGGVSPPRSCSQQPTRTVRMVHGSPPFLGEALGRRYSGGREASWSCQAVAGLVFGVTADGFQDRSRGTGTTHLSRSPYSPAAGLPRPRTPSRAHKLSGGDHRSAGRSNNNRQAYPSPELFEVKRKVAKS